MMPTTSAASTPSRRAMRKAASKNSPVENDLQLQTAVYPPLPVTVKRASAPTSCGSPCPQVEYWCPEPAVHDTSDSSPSRIAFFVSLALPPDSRAAAAVVTGRSHYTRPSRLK